MYTHAVFASVLIEGRGSRVAGKKSRVAGKKSRVKSRGSEKLFTVNHGKGLAIVVE